MSIDTGIVTSLNSWGSSHTALIQIFSNDFVYITALLAGLWIVIETFKAHPPSRGVTPFVRSLLASGLVLFIFPIGLTIIVTELLSKIYVRQRPFVTIPQVKLLVPHSADGGMPSHHVAFMTALVVSVYFYDRRAAALFGVLTLLSAFGRVSAGIHYPSDIIAGIGLGILVVYLYRFFMPKLFTADILKIKP